MKTAIKSAQLIEEIAEFLRPGLGLVEEEIQGVLDTDTTLVREVGEYVLSSRGKMLRPMMLLLACRACGYRGNDDIKVAAALEIIHTATLIHDDVIDKAALRRGRPSVNARWGDDVAILIADYLYANAFRLALQPVNPMITSTICQVTSQMCEGEMFQIEKRQDFLTAEDYLRIVSRKTAFLFSACSGLGGVLAQAGESETLALTRYGLNFGIAFQITDDTLDLVGRDMELGKDSGTDIRNGKQTLPLIHAYEQAGAEDRLRLQEGWSSGRDSLMMVDLIKKHQGIEHAQAVARQHADKAREHLETLKPSRPLELCAQLADYVVERSR